MIKDIFSFFFELVKIIVISLVIIIPVRYFLIQPFYVKGASMEPNFYDHEYLIIDEITYRFRDPERGEIIVFRFYQFGFFWLVLNIYWSSLSKQVN